MSFVADSKILTLAGAQAAAGAAMAEAQRRGVAVTIIVLDGAAEPITVLRMDGIHTATLEVALGKAKSAVKFRRPTMKFWESLGRGDLGLLALPNVVPYPGGVPLMVDGFMVGAIGVSGAAPDVDVTIAEAGAAALGTGAAS